ncbi:unnamed protein product, partial [Heterosigma akashiwo]
RDRRPGAPGEAAARAVVRLHGQPEEGHRRPRRDQEAGQAVGLQGVRYCGQELAAHALSRFQVSVKHEGGFLGPKRLENNCIQGAA